MNNTVGLIVYLLVGFIGGAIGFRLKITGGILIGAMFAIVILNLILDRNLKLPMSYNFVVQVLIGIMVGATFSKEFGRMLLPIFFPVLGSTLVLVSTGIVVSVVLVKIGLLSPSTAFFSTSPGAMSVVLGLAGKTGADLSVILCFHIFRIFFIIITAPLIFRLTQKWLL